MPQQKVNKGIKDINYHNMVVVITVRDKVINKVGGIRPVADKWRLSFSVLQRALSGIKKHRQGGCQYDKLAGRPQRRSRRKEKGKSLEKDKSDEGAPPPKKSKTGKGKKTKQMAGKEAPPQEIEPDDNVDDDLLNVPL